MERNDLRKRRKALGLSQTDLARFGRVYPY